VPDRWPSADNIRAAFSGLDSLAPKREDQAAALRDLLELTVRECPAAALRQLYESELEAFDIMSGPMAYWGAVGLQAIGDREARGSFFAEPRIAKGVSGYLAPWRPSTIMCGLCLG
jgi:hypothetical protein